MDPKTKEFIAKWNSSNNDKVRQKVSGIELENGKILFVREINYNSGFTQYAPTNKGEQLFGKNLDLLLIVTEKNMLFYDLKLMQDNFVKVPLKELAYAKQGFVDDSAIDIVPIGAEKAHGTSKLKFGIGYGCLILLLIPCAGVWFSVMGDSVSSVFMFGGIVIISGFILAFILYLLSSLKKVEVRKTQDNTVKEVIKIERKMFGGDAPEIVININNAIKNSRKGIL